MIEEGKLVSLIIQGKTNYNIAEELNISYGYVRKILMQMFKKYGVKTRTSLVFAYLKPRLVDMGFWDEKGNYKEDWQIVTKEEI